MLVATGTVQYRAGYTVQYSTQYSTQVTAVVLYGSVQYRVRNHNPYYITVLYCIQYQYYSTGI